MADPAVGPQRGSLIWTAATRHTLSREQASLSIPSPWGPTLLLCPGRGPQGVQVKVDQRPQVVRRPPVRSRPTPLGLTLTKLVRFEVSGYAYTAAERYERGADLHDWDKTISRDCELKRNQGIYNVSTPLLLPA